jgi:oxaloacetate decarboxylase alpha subunit
MVGTQAVMNVVLGERYKLSPGEVKAYLKGEYGQAPAPVNEDVKKKIIGDAEVITYRPADKIAPEFAVMKEKYGAICECDEDVLSCALFENVAVKFLESRHGAKEEDEVVEFNVQIG